jgi:hypothetical protein
MSFDFHRAAFIKSFGLGTCIIAFAACSDTGDAPDAEIRAADGPIAIHIDAATTTTDGATAAPDGGTADPDGGTATGFSCTAGKLFAGNPGYLTPDDRPTEGTAITEDPPFPYRMVVFTNGQMITHDGEEIWRASLADGKLHRIAGTESTNQALITGPCAGARFANIFGIALAPDGSLFVSDETANTILKITDPLGASCTVSHYAGTPTDIADGDVSPDNPPNVGNVDAAGASAKFGLPERPAVDAAGNVYVWDNSNDSIRMIANDADHTVTTIATDVTAKGALATPVALGGKVYVYGQTGDTKVFLTSIDPVTKATHDLFRDDAFGPRRHRHRRHRSHRVLQRPGLPRDDRWRDLDVARGRLRARPRLR